MEGVRQGQPCALCLPHSPSLPCTDGFVLTVSPALSCTPGKVPVAGNHLHVEHLAVAQGFLK